VTGQDAAIAVGGCGHIRVHAYFKYAIWAHTMNRLKTHRKAGLRHFSPTSSTPTSSRTPSNCLTDDPCFKNAFLYSYHDAGVNRRRSGPGPGDFESGSVRMVLSSLCRSSKLVGTCLTRRTSSCSARTTSTPRLAVSSHSSSMECKPSGSRLFGIFLLNQCLK
jgi:hypothetical protein